MTDAYFVRLADDSFEPTEHCRGPWDVDACHAGPPTALMAGAAERELPDMQLVRLMVELRRPIPMAGFSVSAEVARRGRSVSTAGVALTAAGEILASAHTLHVAVRPMPPTPTHSVSFPDLAGSEPGPFPISTQHGRPGFADSLEVRYPPGPGDGGATEMWARSVVTIVEGEEASPFQRICPVADCGNGISWHVGTERMSFVNADLIVAVHRSPVGDWFGTRTVSYWEPSGIGRADAELFDTGGAVGRAMQNLVLRPR